MSNVLVRGIVSPWIPGRQSAASPDTTAAHFVAMPGAPGLGVLVRTETGDNPMTYRVYSGPRGSEAIAPMEKDRHLYKEFGSLDEAMGWARHLNNSGRVPLLIDGDDGTHLTK